ncbi:acyl carrier protein [Streptomyces sp. ALB3]|uniref:acyl carrier protein n=1 Tax=Streptomyces sp. ALB3 TaxID=3374278 RepID=UPI0037B6405A
MSGSDDRVNQGGPATEGERRLAALWAEVLGVPAERIRRGDNFFEIGGTSRAAARLVIALERRLTIGEFARSRTLTNMADLLDRRPAPRSGAAVGG